MSNVYSFSTTTDAVSNRFIDRCQPLPTSIKRLDLLEVLLISGCFIMRSCLHFGLYSVLIACIKSEIDTGGSANSLQFAW